MASSSPPADILDSLPTRTYAPTKDFHTDVIYLNWDIARTTAVLNFTMHWWSSPSSLSDTAAGEQKRLCEPCGRMRLDEGCAELSPEDGGADSGLCLIT